MPDSVQSDQLKDEIRRQLAILWQERWARAGLTTIPYAMTLLFLPILLVVVMALVNLVAEILYMKLLRGLVPSRDRMRYKLSQIAVFALELSFSATAALVWQSPSDYAKPFAIGMLASTLIHLATVRAIHLPHGLIGLGAVFLAGQVGNYAYWSQLESWSGFIAGFAALSGGIGYALTAMISNNRLHRAMAITSVDAQAADAAKTMFLAQMSHELRTPLNAIMGLGSYEAAQATTPASKERLKALVSAARDLTIILDDILDLSAIGQGKLPLRLSAIDARKELEAAVSLFGTQRDETFTTLQLSFAEDFPRYLITDPQRLRQCLTNLISNALKYAEGGRISVQVSFLEGNPCTLTIVVADDGPGVRLAEQALIFAPFEKGSGMKAGTGLGLAIARSIARQMGGDLTLQQSGVGATFRLAINVEMAPFGYEPSSPIALDLSGYRVLVVDDVATNRLVVRTMLSSSGAQVFDAETGEAALELLAVQNFDLVLLDINMPGMSGFETLRRIRELPSPKSEIPVLALTADTPKGSNWHYKDKGFHGWITKPLLLENLVKTLRLHLWHKP